MSDEFPVVDEITGEVVSDPDGLPITELVGHDYLRVSEVLSIEERATGERAWRFGHVIVDEAQDLTPMQWRMIVRRARGHSMTIVGDVAQRSIGEARSWSEILPDDLGEVARFDLTTNYRSPSEVADVAARVLGAMAPDIEPAEAIRSSGIAVEYVECAEPSSALDELLRSELESTDGRVAVIGAAAEPESTPERALFVSPRGSKGMEFESVIVVEPADILDLPAGLSLLYVALTRSTERLTIVHSKPLPSYLRP